MDKYKPHTKRCNDLNDRSVKERCVCRKQLQRAPMENGTVILKRTFTMAGIRFWRVLGPKKHPNYLSDLSVDGLKTWGIIPGKSEEIL